MENVTAKITGSVIAITSDRVNLGFFNRDRLATAILLMLDVSNDPNGVLAALIAHHDMDRRDAMRYVIAARGCIDHNIEP